MINPKVALMSLFRQQPLDDTVMIGPKQFTLINELPPTVKDHSFLVKLRAADGEFVEFCVHIAGQGRDEKWKPM